MIEELRVFLEKDEFSRVDYYGPADPMIDRQQLRSLVSGSHVREQLWAMIELAKLGDFACLSEVQPLLVHEKLCIRLHAAQLVVHAGNYEQTGWIEDTLGIAIAEGTPFELGNLLVLLGGAYYSNALELLIGCIGRDVIYGEIEEDLKAALWFFYPFEGLWSFEIGVHGSDVSRAKDVYMEFVDRMPSAKCILGGEVLFLGDVTKKIISKMLGSGGQPLRLSHEPQVLSMFSGAECPLQYNTICTREKARDVLEYTQMVSALDMQPGQKYFYGHLVT